MTWLGLVYSHISGKDEKNTIIGLNSYIVILTRQVLYKGAARGHRQLKYCVQGV